MRRRLGLGAGTPRALRQRRGHPTRSRLGLGGGWAGGLGAGRDSAGRAGSGRQGEGLDGPGAGEPIWELPVRAPGSGRRRPWDENS